MTFLEFIPIIFSMDLDYETILAKRDKADKERESLFGELLHEIQRDDTRGREDVPSLKQSLATQTDCLSRIFTVMLKLSAHDQNISEGLLRLALQTQRQFRQSLLALRQLKEFKYLSEEEQIQKEAEISQREFEEYLARRTHKDDDPFSKN